MRIIHGSGYSEEDKRGYTKLIFQNIFMAMQSMTKAMDNLKVSLEHDSLQEKADEIRNMDYETVTTMDQEWVETLKNLWNDKGVIEVYERRREYQLTDSAK